MGTIWIKRFTGGLDVRRLPETSPSDSLLRLENGDINRGGEIEQRPAFVPAFALPAGATKSMARNGTGITVFGEAAAPLDLATGVTYQQLIHPLDPTLRLARVLSWEYFAAKVYAVAEFEDGGIYHYYDGALVTDWDDKRARTRITFVNALADGVVSSIKINGVEALGAAVPWAGDANSMAKAVANQINLFTSNPEYVAVYFQNVVAILADVDGTAANGRAVAVTATDVAYSLSSAALVNGRTTPGAYASTTFTIASGSPDGAISAILVGGVDILGQSVPWTNDAAGTAKALANQINAYASVPDYTASANGAALTITAAKIGSMLNGVAVNGQAVSFAAQGVTISPTSPGSPAASASTTLTVLGGPGGAGTGVSSIKINGQEILGATIAWATDNNTTAAAIAAQINKYQSAGSNLTSSGGAYNPNVGRAYSPTTNYTAAAVGAVVTITAAKATAAVNTFVVGLTATAIQLSSPLPMSGGADTTVITTPLSGGIAPTYQSGAFVTTGNKKLFCLSRGTLYYSGIQNPTLWFDYEATGAGFTDMSNEASNSETLISIAKYMKYYAIFAQRTVQIWYNDPDPTANQQIQVLANTGAVSPHAVVQYGDNDLFYLDTSGVRSLRSRGDASNSALTTDMGVPVDPVVVAAIEGLSQIERRSIYAAVEPRTGRYLLAIKDTIYVYSSFPEAQIHAWSSYKPGFVIEEMFTHPWTKRVYVRSGDTIYVLGGLSGPPQYDDTQVVVWTAYLNGDDPSREKTFDGVDIASRGVWEVSIGMDPENTLASDKVATIDGTTYLGPDVGGVGMFTHINARLTSSARPTDGGPAILSSISIHYDGAP